MLDSCNFLKILMIHKAFRTHAALTKPIREMFNFYDLPTLCIGFNYDEFFAFDSFF